MMINKTELKLLADALHKLESGYSELPEFAPEFDEAALSAVLDEVAERMQDNYPYFHPQYAGQMLKPPHPVARLAELANMFAWDSPLGHLTGGGTMANLEALWVAGRLHPGKRVIASAQAHYTHSRISEVLGIPFSSVPVSRISY